MSSVPAKHPKKKRRIDDVQEDNQSLPGPSNEVITHAAPQAVKKCSKDSNRSMYAAPKGKYKRIQFRRSASPEFVSPAELYKDLPQEREENSKPVDNSHHIKIIPEQEQCTLDANQPTSSKNDHDSTNTGKHFNSHLKKGKHKTKLGHTSYANRISKFFKSSTFTKHRTSKTQISTESSGTDLTERLPGSSGLKEKEEKILEASTDVNNAQFSKCSRHHYGFDEDGNAINYFKLLPIHIIEAILCQIPIIDLMACRLVCTSWREVIDNEKFMEWKKLYYKYKRVCEKSSSGPKTEVNKIVTAYGYATMEDAIGTILKYMAKGFCRMPSSDMYRLLNQNPKGELADQVLAERFPQYKEKETRVWCQFALAILLSESVWDIFDLYKSLFTSKSACSRPDITDAMYCVASFLLFYLSSEGITCGLHYRIYYVLYLVENHITKFQIEKLKFVKGLPSLPSSQVPSEQNISTTDSSHLTYEQFRVLNHKFAKKQKIRIIALAGTGSTTTLISLSRLYSEYKFLLLVFNKTVCDEARRKFPPNVTCKTPQSLAYSVVGKLFRHKLTTTLRPYDLIGHLKHNEGHIQIYAYASLVLTTINNFTISSTMAMGLTHVPTVDYNRKVISHLNRDRILMDAYKIWQKMIDEKDSFKMTHEIYLKLFHINKPILSRYHCIILDEAQDCSPAVLDIVANQEMPIIFVGDPHQQMNGSRGSQNALQSITATHTYHLTQSFRFGPEIAYAASCILELALHSKSTVVGNNEDSSITGKVVGQYALITRSDVTLFNEALRMIVFKRLKKQEPTEINATFAGGFNSYGFDQISDIFKLKTLTRGERQLTDKFISRFKTYNDLVNYAKYADDKDLLYKIEVANQHDRNIFKFINVLKEKCNYPMEVANVVFTTIDKARGLAFDTVCIADDFTVSDVPSYIESDAAREEANILYVAMTRAKSSLLLPEKMKKILYRAHEKFEYVAPAKRILQDKASLNCVQCNDAFTPRSVLLMMRKEMMMASDRVSAGGPLCLKCCSDPTMRPDIHLNGLVMYLDITSDNAHRFMSSIVGPLPGDPPVIHDRFAEFENADRVFVINLNVL